METKIIYYKDEKNDEFSNAKIEPVIVDMNYKFIHNNFFWKIGEAISLLISIPIKALYPRIKFHIKYVGKDKMKPYKRMGCFIYANHTQQFCDTFIPTNMVFPKKNAFIVNPENISIKGLKLFVRMLNPIPIPNKMDGMPNFLNAIEHYIFKKHASVTIYPEAHIWPYCSFIRDFKDVSFKYPVKYNVPAFCITNVYKKYGRKKDKIQIISFLDGPFFANTELKSIKQQQKDLRDRIYNQMCERAKESESTIYEYKKRADVND